MASSSLSPSPGPSSSDLGASLTYPLTACLPSQQRSAGEPSTSFPSLFGRRQASNHSSGRGRDDFASLLHRSSRGDAGTDTESDTDAISLLSGIAARSPTSSTAARARAVERARQRRREQRARQAGLWGLGDWASEMLACGLFGRPKSQRRRQGLTEERGERDTDTALREPLLEGEGTGDEDDVRLRDSELESGDEDARSLAEEALDAQVAASRDQLAQESVPAKASKPNDQAVEDDISALQAAEEAALAAEEEQAVLDAQRKAADKAARDGLLAREATKSSQIMSQAEIEAEAEAAAGGFDVDEEAGPLHDGQDEDMGRDGYYDVDEDRREEAHSEADGPYYDDEASQPAIVHHHHYYDYQPSEQHTTDPLSSTALASPSTVHPEPDETLQDGADEEDEADMAGLGLGPRRKSGYSASANRSSDGKVMSRDGSSANDRVGSQRYSGRGTGSLSGSGSGSGTGSAAPSRRSGEKHYQYPAAALSASRESSGPRKRHGSAGPPSLGSSSNNGARRYQLPRTAHKMDDRAADAAAGGFDDWEVPASAAGGAGERTEQHEEEGEEAVQEDVDVWGSPSSHISPKKMSYRERRYLGDEQVSDGGRGGTAGSSDGGRSSGGRSGRSRKERRATAMDEGLEEADGL